jgi:hypothetical protein
MDPDSQLPVVRLEDKKARRLADLTGIYMDLSFTIDACKVIMEFPEHEQDTTRGLLFREALWTSALISYARCFAPGKRYGLSEATLATLGEDYLEVHKVFLGLRNKHIAHSVNPFEQVEVGLVLSEEGAKDRMVEAIVVYGIKLAYLNRPAAIDLHNLAATLRNEIGRLANEAEEATLEDARRVQVEELYKKPRLQIRAPHAGETDKPRGQNA